MDWETEEGLVKVIWEVKWLENVILWEYYLTIKDCKF